MTKPRKPRKIVPMSPGVAVPFGDGGIEITMLGEPLPQSRPRVTTKGVFSSDSPELRAWRKSIAGAALAMRPRCILESTPTLAVAFMGMPTKDQSRWGEMHAQTPDVDNLAKGILDALQDSRKVRKAAKDLEDAGGPAYVQALPIADDSDIGGLVVVKVWTPPPGVLRIRLEPIPWPRQSLAWTMRRLAWHVGDPAFVAWPESVDP